MTNETTIPLTQCCVQQSCVISTPYLGNLAPYGRHSMRSLLQQVATSNEWSEQLSSKHFSIHNIRASGHSIAVVVLCYGRTL